MEMLRAMWPLLVLGGLLVVALGVIAALKGGSGGGEKAEEEKVGAADVYVKRAGLMTPAELAFYKVLVAAVAPKYVVMAQVSLAGLLEVDRKKVAGEGGAGGKRASGFQAAFNRINRKTADFVICEPGTMRIVAAVELDDRSHERAERKERDGFVEAAMKAAGLPLLRVKAAGSYDLAGVRGMVEGIERDGAVGSPSVSRRGGG